MHGMGRHSAGREEGEAHVRAAPADSASLRNAFGWIGGVPGPFRVFSEQVHTETRFRAEVAGARLNFTQVKRADEWPL
jgi:hypothetical protein